MVSWLVNVWLVGECSLGNWFNLSNSATVTTTAASYKAVSGLLLLHGFWS